MKDVYIKKLYGDMTGEKWHIVVWKKYVSKAENKIKCFFFTKNTENVFTFGLL